MCCDDLVGVAGALGIADTIHVMYRGEIMASFDADEADEETITTIAVGGSLERR